MKVSRRKFIQGSACASLLYSLPSKANLLNYNPNTNQFVFQILVPDGMDVTLSLDPLTHAKFNTDQADVFIEYRPDQIFGNGKLLLGPACEALRPYLNEIAVVNGIVMRRDTGHEALLSYIASGSGSAALPYIAVESNHILQEPTLGVLIAGSVKMGQRLATLTQIENLKQLGTGNNQVSYLNPFYNNVSNLLSTEIQNLVDFNFRKSELASEIDKVKSLLNSDYEEIPVIIGSFLKGMSKTAVLDISRLENMELELDTHSNHESEHLSSQMAVWNFIAHVFDCFKKIEYNKGSLFDNTTFIVMSEFSRTPFLNGARGKDHNVYTNSVLLAGGRVQGGKSVGESKMLKRSQRPDGIAIHIGKPFDFSLGQSVNTNGENVNLIYPENLAKSFRGLYNQSENFYPQLTGIKEIKGLFKS